MGLPRFYRIIYDVLSAQVAVRRYDILMFLSKYYPLNFSLDLQPSIVTDKDPSNSSGQERTFISMVCGKHSIHLVGKETFVRFSNFKRKTSLLFSTPVFFFLFSFFKYRAWKKCGYDTLRSLYWLGKTLVSG